MRLERSEADLEFRLKVRAFFETQYPQDVIDRNRRGVLPTREDHVRGQSALNAVGWLAPGWPKVHGGAGFDPVQRFIFEQEYERAGALPLQPMGIIYVAPVIYTFGTAAQKAMWLPDILESRAFWAQGYSEPEAGSDLASLRTSAVRDGNNFIVNGEKIWTSMAQWADWIFCLVRTSTEGRKQEGISFICFPMNLPGITVQPIISIDGSHHLNRVVLDNVKVPSEYLIGEEGAGWHYANVLLARERLSYAHLGEKKDLLAQIIQRAATIPLGEGRMLGSDSSFRAHVARCSIAIAALEHGVLGELAEPDASGVKVSMLKIAATQLAQDLTELFRLAAGEFGHVYVDRTVDDWAQRLPTIPAWAPVATANYLFARAQTIYGGATEIQKNIMAKRLIRA